MAKVIQNNLRHIRLQLMAERGEVITQTEMARLLGLGNNVQQYNAYERQHKQPSLLTVLLFADVLKMTVEQIVYLQKDNTEK